LKALTMDSNATIDRLAIRDLIENWALWRDAGDWARFATLWADDSWISATWFQGSGQDFIRVTIEGWNKGVSILHFLGGTTIDLAGARAWAQTKITISQRADVHGIECDVVCTGRFHDLLEKRDGQWLMVLRQPTYEKDRLDPVDPAAVLQLDRTKLELFHAGYRNLAYVQQLVGYEVKRDMPGLKGADTDALYAHCRAWLQGGPSRWVRP
jgi:SnoaL-like domain